MCKHDLDNAQDDVPSRDRALGAVDNGDSDGDCDGDGDGCGGVRSATEFPMRKVRRCSHPNPLVAVAAANSAHHRQPSHHYSSSLRINSDCIYSYWGSAGF